ncbi:hypothetical protein ABN362_22355 [Providencia alcalifaciens]|uniref:hypothetical protein n=1 Tax=Providencia alcalifaciens TaxID=126385 RepID=UPI0032DAA274
MIELKQIDNSQSLDCLEYAATLAKFNILVSVHNLKKVEFDFYVTFKSDNSSYYHVYFKNGFIVGYRDNLSINNYVMWDLIHE